MFVSVHSGITKRLHAQFTVGQDADPAPLQHPPIDSFEESPQVEPSLPRFQDMDLDFLTKEVILDSLREVQKNTHTNEYFMKPVNTKKVTDYNDFVKNPMVFFRCV